MIAAAPERTTRKSGHNLMIGLVPSTIAIGLRAWIFMLYWGWFVVPVTGFRGVSAAEAFGLMVAVLYVVPKRDPRSTNPLWRDALISVGYSAVWLITGWCAQWLIGLGL